MLNQRPKVLFQGVPTAFRQPDGIGHCYATVFSSEFHNLQR